MNDRTTDLKALLARYSPDSEITVYGDGVLLPKRDFKLMIQFLSSIAARPGKAGEAILPASSLSAPLPSIVPPKPTPSDSLGSPVKYADRSDSREYEEQPATPPDKPELCDDEGCPHHGKPHVCIARVETAKERAARLSQPDKVEVVERAYRAAWDALHNDAIFSDENRSEFIGRLNSTKSAWLHVAVRAALASLPQHDDSRLVGWQPIEAAPKNGTPIEVGHLVRYLPYKPDGKRQMGKDGRWQEWNGYGWSNVEWEPESWQPAKAAHPKAGA